MVLPPDFGGEVHPVQFLYCDIGVAVALSRLAAVFYLGKINHAGFFRDDIDFADSGLPVAADDLMAIAFQPLGDGLFGG
jgi:hypothetical protein